MVGERYDQATGCIMLTKAKRGKHIDLIFRENPNDYYILKRTNSFRFITDEEFRRYNYGGYIFFFKKIYDINHIEKWLKFINVNKIDMKYLNKPFPDFDPIKIIVRNGQTG